MTALADTYAFAEVALRRYARATNLSIAGRVFAMAESAGDNPNLDTLATVLRRLGARVLWADTDAQTRTHHPSVSATFRDEGGEPVVTTEGPTVDADGNGCSIHVLDDARPSIDAERVAVASANMPVMHAFLPSIAEACQNQHVVIGSTLALEPKTVALLLGLHEAGVEIRAFGWPDELQLPMLDVLADHGIEMFVASRTMTGPRQEFATELEQAQRDFLAADLDYLVDDGGHLLVRAASGASVHKKSLRGGSEETTSGIRLLARHELPFPVMAANDAPMKTMFDNAFGTGQSCAFTMLDVMAATGRAWPVFGKRIVIVGFGPVGEGTARHFAALGGTITVVELDVQRALFATYQGFRVAPLIEAVQNADLVVSATGVFHTITRGALLAMPDRCAVGVAGGVDDEIALDDLAAAGVNPVDASCPGIASHGSMQVWRRTPNEHGVVILDHGSCINLSAGEGNPIDIMDYSFAVQLQAIRHLLTHDTLAPGLQALPQNANDEVAKKALAVAQVAPFSSTNAPGKDAA